MSAGDEKLRAMIDRHLDPDNDPNALPPQCQHCPRCRNTGSRDECISEDDEEEKGEEG